jgi:hypothetical protein
VTAGLRRRGWFLFAVGFSTVVAAIAEETSVANQPPIELPKFEVRDSRLLPRPESWHYAEVPGFEILSNISEHETKRFARDFLLLQEVIQAIMPVLTERNSDMPTTLILCGRANGFDAFVPVNRDDDRFSTNVLFFENAEHTVIVDDFALAELDLDASTRVEADPYRSFYREYFRFLIRRKLGSHPPPWLEEGLVQIFSGIDFNKKWIDFGRIGTEFGETNASDFNERLHKRWLMPLDQMFLNDGTQHDAFWAAECFAFVHMCLYQTGRPYQKSFIEFVSRLEDEPLSESLFKECFHRSYSQMLTEIRGYIDFTAHTYVQITTKRGHELPEPPAVVVRDATPAEIGRVKGEALRLGGHTDEARLELIAPYVRGDKEPRLLAALGLDEVAAGHDDRARKFLEEAARLKATRARAYVELARLRYKAALAAAGESGRLNSEQVNSVFAALKAARAQPPPLADEFALAAEVWAHAATKPTREEFLGVAQGVRFFPFDANLLMQTIQLAVKLGFGEDAQVLAERGVKAFARKPAERDQFALLAASFKHDAKPKAEEAKPQSAIEMMPSGIDLQPADTVEVKPAPP